MSEQSQQENNVAPIVPEVKVRVPSAETVLKQEKRKLERELATLTEKKALFVSMQKEMEAVDTSIEKLTGKLTKVKTKLIEALGLA
jgi:predicted aspartyl protease